MDNGMQNHAFSETKTDSENLDKTNLSSEKSKRQLNPLRIKTNSTFIEKPMNIDGLSHFQSSKLIIAKILWFTIFISGLVIAGLFINTRFSEYKNAEISTQINTLYNNELDLPTATICLKNAWDDTDLNYMFYQFSLEFQSLLWMALDRCWFLGATAVDRQPCLYCSCKYQQIWNMKKGFLDYLWLRGDYYQALEKEYRGAFVAKHWHWTNSWGKLSTGEGRPLFEVFLYQKETIECPDRESEEVVEYLEDWANFCANNFGEILDLLQVSSLSYTDSGIPEGLGYDADMRIYWCGKVFQGASAEYDGEDTESAVYSFFSSYPILDKLSYMLSDDEICKYGNDRLVTIWHSDVK